MNNNRVRLLTYRYAFSFLVCFCLNCISVSVGATTTEVFFFSHDQQGSITSISDEKNQLGLQQGWSPWGARRDNNSQSALTRFAQGHPVRLGYTGHKQLLDANLVLAGDTRLYDPELKRFYNTDDRTTGGVRGNNRFAYAYNNPLAYVDPDGHAPEPNLILDTPIGETMVLHQPGQPFEEGVFYNTALRLPAGGGRMSLSSTALSPDAEWPLFIGSSLDPVPPAELKCSRVYARLPGHAELLGLAEGCATVGDVVDFVTPPLGGQAVLRAHETIPGSRRNITGTGRYAFGGFMVNNGKVIFNPYYSAAAAGQFSVHTLKANYRRRYHAELQADIIDATLGNSYLTRSPPNTSLKLIPIQYYGAMLRAISRTTNMPIELENSLHSEVYTWNTRKHGPIDTAMAGHLGVIISGCNKTLLPFIERLNQKIVPVVSAPIEKPGRARCNSY